ncbi:MAG: hypothetical protein ACLR6O_04835 [Eubacterium sp.]
MQEPEVALANSEHIYYRSANYTVEQTKKVLFTVIRCIFNAKRTYFSLPQAQMSLKTGCGQKSKAAAFNRQWVQDRKIYSQCAVLGAA